MFKFPPPTTLALDVGARVEVCVGCVCVRARGGGGGHGKFSAVIVFNFLAKNCMLVLSFFSGYCWLVLMTRQAAAGLTFPR